MNGIMVVATRPSFGDEISMYVAMPVIRTELSMENLRRAPERLNEDERNDVLVLVVVVVVWMKPFISFL